MDQWGHYEGINSDVFRRNFQDDIVNLLDLDAIRPQLIQAGLLTEEEKELLSRQSLSSQVRIQELTKILSQKGSSCVPKFLECLAKEACNSDGHAQLLKTITKALDDYLSSQFLPPDPKRIRISSTGVMKLVYY